MKNAVIYAHLKDPQTAVTLPTLGILAELSIGLSTFHKNFCTHAATLSANLAAKRGPDRTLL